MYKHRGLKGRWQATSVLTRRFALLCYQL